ncbi:MAG: 30S ribosomal protein S17e [Candidatus Methanosuratincola petrocarbonis]|nr:30S ribosomal protein S17e [Candidatus Methanosuratincola sp.]
MGKVRIGKVKSISNELVLKFGNVFTTDFEENKKLVQQYTDITSKRLKNRVAGYITRLKVNEKKREEAEAAEAEKVEESEPKQTLDVEGEPKELEAAAEEPESQETGAGGEAGEPTDETTADAVPAEDEKAKTSTEAKGASP